MKTTIRSGGLLLAACVELLGCGSTEPATSTGTGAATPTSGAGDTTATVGAGTGGQPATTAAGTGGRPATTSASAQTTSSATASTSASTSTSTSTTASTSGGGRDAGPPPPPDGGGVTGAGPEQCIKRAAVDTTRWKLVWADEFATEGPPDPANWGFEHGFVRNQELQWYQTDNATVAGGLLTIAARREQVPNPNYKAGSSDWKTNRQNADYTSSSINTSGKHSWTYGRFEICARIDTRQGSWPAFWWLGSGVGWPQGGEVDIMEYYANKVLANVCKPSGSTCNWASTNQSLSSLGGDAWSSAFHLWAMEWDAQNINLYLDDKVTNQFTVSSAVGSGQTNPYVGKPAYLLVNLAIGANGGDPSKTTFPMNYEVDYVRVYQKP